MLKLIVEEFTKDIKGKLESFKEDEKSKVLREEVFNTFGPEAFLDQENKEYMIVNPETGKVRSDLIFASYLKAAVQECSCSGEKKEKASKIKKKAKKLFEDNNCEKDLNIKINDFQHSVIDITELMFIDAEELELDWVI